MRRYRPAMSTGTRIIIGLLLIVIGILSRGFIPSIGGIIGFLCIAVAIFMIGHAMLDASRNR